MTRPDAPSDLERFFGAGDIAPGTCKAFFVGRYDVAVFNVGGKLFALENSCPHQGGPLSDGWLEESVVTCPWHGSTFCVRDGSIVNGPTTYPQPTFSVRVIDGRVRITATDGS